MSQEHSSWSWNLIALSLQKVITEVAVINNDMGDTGMSENKCPFGRSLPSLWFNHLPGLIMLSIDRDSY